MIKFKVFFVFILSFALSNCSLSFQKEPIFTLNPGVDTVEINTSFTDAGAIAIINDSFLDIEVITNNVDITKVGTYEIIYQLTYNDENYYLKRIVNVVDTTPPIANLNQGVDTISISSVWVDAGVSATDNSFGEITITTEGLVDNTVVGEYEIKYFITDEYKNTTIISRFVSVIP